MARKRKSYRKTTSRRRRRVGAMSLNPSSPVVKAVAAGGGFLAAGTINPLIDKVLPASLTAGTGVMGYLPAAIQVAPAAFLLLTGKKVSPVISIAALVLAGAGVKRGLTKAGILSGFGLLPTINGFNQIPSVGAIPPQLSGVPPQLSGGFRTRMMNGFKTRNVVGGFDANGSNSGINYTDR